MARTLGASPSPAPGRQRTIVRLLLQSRARSGRVHALRRALWPAGFMIGASTGP
jgi:hypothetical protein